jgi:hypothetical protein
VLIEAGEEGAGFEPVQLFGQRFAFAAVFPAARFEFAHDSTDQCGTADAPGKFFQRGFQDHEIMVVADAFLQFVEQLGHGAQAFGPDGQEKFQLVEKMLEPDAPAMEVAVVAVVRRLVPAPAAGAQGFFEGRRAVRPVHGWKREPADAAAAGGQGAERGGWDRALPGGGGDGADEVLLDHGEIAVLPARRFFAQALDDVEADHGIAQGSEVLRGFPQGGVFLLKRAVADRGPQEAEQSAKAFDGRAHFMDGFVLGVGREVIEMADGAAEKEIADASEADAEGLGGREREAGQFVLVENRGTHGEEELPPEGGKLPADMRVMRPMRGFARPGPLAAREMGDAVFFDGCRWIRNLRALMPNLSAAEKIAQIKADAEAEVRKLTQEALAELQAKRVATLESLKAIDAEIEALTGKPAGTRRARKAGAPKAAGLRPDLQELKAILAKAEGKTLDLRREGYETANVKTLAEANPGLLRMGGKGAWPTVTLLK